MLLWAASHQLDAIRFISLFVLNVFSSVQSFQLCRSLCNAMDCSMPGFSIHHQLSELTQAHVHRLVDATISSCLPLLVLPSVFPNNRDFPNKSILPIRWANNWSFSFSINPSSEYSGLITIQLLEYNMDH